MHRHHHFHRGRWDHDGPRHGGGGHRRSERVFEQGDLRLVILKLIADQPRHGYEIIKAIEDALGGAYTPSPGVVYPTLTFLEETGLALVEPGPDTKKRYAITEEGRAHLEKNAPAVEAALARAETVGGDRIGMLRVRRAMANLKTALRLRAVRGAISDPEVDTIVAAIDQAAAAVERS